MRNFVLIFSLNLLFIPNMFSQKIPDLVTDRPDKTESALVVPEGALQIESGAEYFSDRSIEQFELNSLSLAATLFRYGLLENLELRLGSAYLSQEIKSGNISSDVSGISDFMIGAKYEFVSDHHSVPDIGLMLHFFLPVGAEAFKPDKTEPQAILSVSKSLSEYLDIGTNLGVHYNSSAEDAFYFYTIAAGFGITEKLGSFVELYSEVLPNSSPQFLAGAGFTYLLQHNLQFDIYGGNGLFNNSKVWYFGAGISIRIPR
jgi:hypothetical protein